MPQLEGGGLHRMCAVGLEHQRQGDVRVEADLAIERQHRDAMLIRAVVGTLESRNSQATGGEAAEIQQPIARLCVAHAGAAELSHRSAGFAGDHTLPVFGKEVAHRPDAHVHGALNITLRHQHADGAGRGGPDKHLMHDAQPRGRVGSMVDIHRFPIARMDELGKLRGADGDVRGGGGRGKTTGGCQDRGIARI